MRKSGVLQPPNTVTAAFWQHAPQRAGPPPFSTEHELFMDIERVNAIGNTLADLSARTQALRGYL